MQPQSSQAQNAASGLQTPAASAQFYGVNGSASSALNQSASTKPLSVEVAGSSNASSTTPNNQISRNLDEGSSFGFVVWLVVAIAVVLLVSFYRRSFLGTNTNAVEEVPLESPVKKPKRKKKSKKKVHHH